MISQFLPAELRKQAAAARHASRNAVALIRLGHWCGLITAAGGCLVIAGYVFGIEAIWRPIPGGPSTHPTTALLFIISGCAVAAMKPMRTPGAAIAALAGVAVVATVRIIGVASGVTILPSTWLFAPTLAREAAEGASVNMGWNSAAMFVLVSVAFLLRHWGRPRTSQIVAAVGMAPPLVSLTGYLYGVQTFYGHMSLTTSLIGIVLAVTPVLLSARTGIMRAICSPWDGARFGRLEIVVIGAIVLAGGFVIQQLTESVDSSLIPAFVVGTVLAASTTIAYCSIIIERNDYLRRRAERTVFQLVLRDPLSGLYNRRFLKEQGKGIVAFAKRQRFQVSVMMVDIDHFKSVNDNYGHPVGDKVIRRVADTVKERIRSTDIAIRYGGEELLAILLDADTEAAARVAEEVRTTIEGINFSDLGFRTLTVSIGVAQVLASLTEAIGRADVALYLAKESGRNRVVSDETRLGLELVQADADAPGPLSGHVPARRSA
jgi:diguanylate cyclase (GGDEF)-like protein